jgi:uncharacterized Zn finger protein (UPF0148 family)
MRCPTCEKFVSLELQEPESPDVSVEYNGDPDARRSRTHGLGFLGRAPGFIITGSIRIVRTCAECGEELKEATLDIDQEVEVGEDLTAAEKTEAATVTTYDDAEVEDESVESIEEGGGRYKKSYFGAEVTFVIRAGPENAVVARVTWSDKVAASQMDENA